MPRVLRAALLVFLLSLTLRVSWASLATVTPISDFHGYDSLATKWLTTGEFGAAGRLAYRTPGYPAFLAAAYAVFGHSWKAAALIQALLGAITSGLLVTLAARAVSLRASVIAGLLHALSPTALAYVPVLASENVAVPLLVAGLLCLRIDSPSPWRQHAAVAGSGLMLGLSLLVRPATVLFLPACLLLAVWHPPARTFRSMSAITFLAVTAIVLAPWLVRNYQVGLGPGTLSTTGGVNLWMGNNDLARSGGYLRGAQTLTGLSEREKDRAYRAAAFRWMRQRPQRYLALSGTRGCRFVGTPPDGWAAKYLVPTAGNDAATVAAYSARLRGSSLDDSVRHGRRVAARNAKLLERLRRVSAPLTLLALGLSFLRWRSFAIVVLPALCYASGLSLTFVAERFRELWNPMVFIPLAALLSDLLFGTKDLGARLARPAKSVLSLAAVGASLVASAANFDEHWYRLRPLPASLLKVSGYEFTPISFEEPVTQYRSYWDHRARCVRLTASNNVLQCTIQGGSDLSGGQYGGVKLPARSPTALRLELSFLQPQNIQAAYVDGYDGRGYKPDEKRCVRWHWQVGPKTPLPKGRETYVLVPGKPSGYFVPEGETNGADVAEIHVFLRIIPGSSAGFILHHAEVAR